MPVPNPFFALQARLRELLAASTYFAGLQPEQILTEQVGDLEYQVFNALIPLGFGAVITTAQGKSTVSEYEALILGEDLNISITHNPTLDTTHNILDALWAAITAIHGKDVGDIPSPTGRPFDFFSVSGHQRRLDAPKDLVVHELYIHAGLRLS